jgi:phosphomannomutase
MEGPARLESFKAYDVRGKVPEQLDERMAELIGRVYAELIQASRVVVGHDIRLTSADLTAALSRGLTAAGVDVVDIGLVGTEEVYHATFSLGLDGGIMVTASHNPREYNGMKFTREKARPISSDTGLFDIEERVRVALQGGPQPATAQKPGSVERKDMRPAFIEHLLTYIDPGVLRPLKVVVNPGNGGAGPVIDMLEPHLPLQFVKIHDEADGTFPLGETSIAASSSTRRASSSTATTWSDCSRSAR